MRDLPQVLKDTWAGGDYSGPRRPMVRATAQQALNRITDIGYNKYASIPFGSSAVPLELPNIKSLSWDRSVDSDVSSATMELYNCEPLPLDVLKVQERRPKPGYFTFNRGLATDAVISARWDVTPNEWTGLLVPDNLIRTYEGYGFDPAVCPEKDPYLVQTGVWLIDVVNYNSNGTITLQMRDLARVLLDQICFPPVTPMNFYPVAFATDKEFVGVEPGRTYTKLVTSGGDFDPLHPPDGWTGPIAAPSAGTITTDVDGQTITLNWDAPSITLPATYVIDGYRIFVNNVMYGTKYPATPTIGKVTGLTAGVPYLISVAAVYRRVKDGKREFGLRSAPILAQPRFIPLGGLSDTGLATLRTTNVAANTDRDGALNAGETHPGMVAWSWGVPFAITQPIEDVTWRIILFRPIVGTPGAREVKTFQTTFTVTTTNGAYDFQTDEPDLTLWNILIWPTWSEDIPVADNSEPPVKFNVVGGGYQSFAQPAGSFFSTPDFGAPPQEPPYKTVTPTTRYNVAPMTFAASSGGGGPVQTGMTGTGSGSTTPYVYTVVKDDWLIKIAERFGIAGGWQEIYRDNKAVIGDDPNLILPGQKLALRITVGSNGQPDPATDGHKGPKAFDTNPSSYWLSPEVSTPASRPDKMVWLQSRLKNRTVDFIKIAVVNAPVEVYVSVFSRGVWRTGSEGGTIPYRATNAATDIGARLPYVVKARIAVTGNSVTLKMPIPYVGVSALRLTFHYLPVHASTGDRRIGVADFGAFAYDMPNVQTYGPLDDDTSDQVVSTYVVNVPPIVHPGAGQKPGTYNDYTDIVKIMCAWGGFYWPSDGEAGETEAERLTRLANEVRVGLRTFDEIRLAVDAETVATEPWEPIPSTGTTPPSDRNALAQGFQAIYDRVRQIFIERGVTQISTYFQGPAAQMTLSDGTTVAYPLGAGQYGLPNLDPVLGDKPGRVWGDFEQTGTAGIVKLPEPQWDKKTLMDGIAYVREIIGFLFWVDETGGVVWRAPNIYSIGNDVATISQAPRRTDEVIAIDEHLHLTQLGVSLDGKNIRERIFVANTTGTVGDLAQGYNPNPIGLRRVGGWTDQNFESEAECRVMADFIALRQLFSYRTDNATIPANPALQINDQIRIIEETTAESFLHYIKGISSSNNRESGEWDYTLSTHWLGEKPFDSWVFNPANLSQETQDYLDAVGKTNVAQTTTPPFNNHPPGDLDMAILVKNVTSSTLYVTNGVNKRYVNGTNQAGELFDVGIIPTKTPKVMTATLLALIPTVGAAAPTP